MADDCKPEDHRADTETRAARSLSDHISDNVKSVAALQRRDEEMTSGSQRLVERISRILGRSAYLLGLLIFVVLWVTINVWRPFGIPPFDPLPFAMLDGILTFSALVTATVVLIAQNRQAKRELQHRHLDLQVSLLTEQKVTKLIHLIEELRRDLPMAKDRDDPHAMALQEAANTATVVSAMDEVGLVNAPDHEAEDQE